MELVSGALPRPGLRCVVFDFDGTLSWLRHGWPGLMADIFRQYYPARPGETEPAIRDLLLDDILSLNGKPSIHQMRSFAQRVRERGGRCPAPGDLLHEYQGRLDALIAQRSAQLRCGEAGVDDFVVHGARVLLDKLRRRGLRLAILSGTIQHRVEEEARLLELAGYFDAGIIGGTPDPAHFSKKDAIARLLRQENIPGERLLSLGDGPVEIEEAKLVGGVAVAVASDEEINGSGRPDPWKRRILLQAGADALIADFRHPEQLLELIFGH